MEIFNLKYKKLNKLAKEPTRGSAAAAGYDLYAATDEKIIVPTHETVKVGTGLAFELPDGVFGAIFARSGLATKRGLRPANCVGVIDADYRGEVMVALHNHSFEEQIAENGERIAQLVIAPFYKAEFELAEESNDTIRGDGGFGSTGK